MRLQLATIAVVSLAAATAGADGTVSARGVYYKERATRVMQPMLDAMFEVGAKGLVDGHFLVDAITSASASSGAADAKPFTESRYEGGLGYTHQLDDLKLGVDAKYSTESDYKSIYAGVRGELELAEKNTVVGLGGGFGRDTISGGAGGGLGQLMLMCRSGAPETPECNLTTYAVYASASQILSRTALVSVSVDYAALRGYQSNPYRSAIVGTGTAIGTLREQHPDNRDRTAVAVSGRYHITRSDTTLVGSYRFYRDDWKVHAHTPELRAIQQVGSAIDASLRYRYYKQTTDAFFYMERYPEAQTYISDDVKLSKFTGHTIEAKLGMLGDAVGLGGRWAGARFEGILQYVIQNNRFGNAVVAHVALTLPFEY